MNTLMNINLNEIFQYTNSFTLDGMKANISKFLMITMLMTGFSMTKKMEAFLHQNRVLIERSLGQKNLNIRNWYRFANITVSLAHSIVSSIVALVCIYKCPSLLWSFVDEHYLPAFLILSFSGGYFIADSVINIRRRKQFKRSWKDCSEILVHHALVSIDILLSIHYLKYAGGLLTALLSEVNNIFLHLRSLALLVNIEIKSSNRWIWLTHMVVLSNILFRLIPTLAIAYRFTFDLKNLHPNMTNFDYFFAISSLTMLIVYQNVMMVRIINHDFKARPDDEKMN
ncbi:TLC domain-containing protein 1-like [Brevipalpus obovatus]|uniref:TLC domain-containing protein 1-like n=1 Tax=Brevipalpus obovatus TaxID=246614 RepID=UPI003D9EDF69